MMAEEAEAARRVARTHEESCCSSTNLHLHHLPPPPHLPRDILEHILLKLPVKSLLRFKSVSKPWLSLISDPPFVKSHLTAANSEEEGQVIHGGLICLHNSNFCFPPHSRVSVSFSCVGGGDIGIKAVEKVETDAHGYPKSDGAIFLGSCNGLLFLTMNRLDVVLWNPCTGRYKTIRNSRNALGLAKQVLGGKCVISGLCYYDSSSSSSSATSTAVDGFKAVIGKRDQRRNGCFRIAVVDSNADYYEFKEYGIGASDGDDSGKLRFPYKRNYDDAHCTAVAGVTVNGAPHWVLDRVDDDPNGGSRRARRAIVYFDCAEERFKEVPLSESDPFRQDSYNKIHLVALGGLLCAAVAFNTYPGPARVGGGVVEVWGMKEHGVKESWTKLFAVNYCVYDDRRLRILGFVKSGEVVLLQIDEHRLVSYNIKTGVKKYVWSMEGKPEFVVATYVPSLAHCQGFIKDRM